MAAQPISLFQIGTHQGRRKLGEFSTIQVQVEQPYIPPKLELAVTNMQERKHWETSGGKTALSIDDEGLIPQSVTAPYGRNSSIVISEIDALKGGVEDEAIPTDFAYQNARSIVESAYGQVRSKNFVPNIIPHPIVTTDDAGGIRLAWRHEEKHVRVNFGATPNLRSYLYFEFRLEHVVEQLDAENLARRIAWLTARV